jgi:hypothetical protein
MIQKYILSFLVALPLAAQWTDLASTTQHAVAPVDCAVATASYCTGSAANYSYNDNAYNVMNAWGGAAADTVNNRLIIWGGGHVDYSGNEVYVLNLGVTPPTMTRVTSPSPFATSGETNLDGTPTSRHTYGGLVYLPNENAMFAWGDGVAPGGGPSTNTWWFNLSTNTWTEKAAVPSTGNSGLVCQLDSTQAIESVVCIDFQNGQMFRYTPGTNAWVTLSGYSTTLIAATSMCAVHTSQQVMICAGAYPGYGQPAGIYSINLAPGSTYAAANITAATSGCDALYGVNAPGIDYDSSTGMIVSYSGTGNTVTLFDVLSGNCTTRTFSGGPTASGYAAGVWGRFAYFPKLNKHVIVNNANSDAFTLTLHANGLGYSTLTCVDIDGDGYGTGPGCLGPDADDTDATVHSPAQVIAKYGSINTFLAHIGYQNLAAPSTVTCIDAVRGNDSTGARNANADTACANPYKTWNVGAVGLSSPYIVLFRQGTYTQYIAQPPSGTASAQNILMSYPGELATEDYSAGVGQTINMGGTAYVTVDGLKIKGNASGPGYGGGTYILYNTGRQQITAVGDVLRRCEISGGGDDSNVDADNTINMTIEENVVHDVDPSGQHNVYLGSNTVGSSGVNISRNILYNVYTGGYPNLQFNGRCAGCRFEQNLLYNADGQQIALLSGVSNSFVRGNLVFNTGTAGNPPRSFTIFDYDSGQCQVTGLPSICPWDQTGNVIENNTFWAGTLGIDGSGATTPGYTLTVTQQSTAGPCGNGGRPPCGNLGGNLFRNNIIVDLSGSSTVPPVYYSPGNPVNYLALDTWTNNIIQNAAGSSTYVASAAGTALTCTAFSSVALGGSGCSTANPTFVAANASYYNSPSSFNFSLAPGSPAINAGTATGAPPFDIWGNVRPNPPSIGAMESAGPSVGAPSPGTANACDLNYDGVVNNLDVQIAVNQVLGTSPCTNADLQGTGQCTVVDVQRVINASLGGACRTGS